MERIKNRWCEECGTYLGGITDSEFQRNGHLCDTCREIEEQEQENLYIDNDYNVFGDTMELNFD